MHMITSIAIEKAFSKIQGPFLIEAPTNQDQKETTSSNKEKIHSDQYSEVKDFFLRPEMPAVTI